MKLENLVEYANSNERQTVKDAPPVGDTNTDLLTSAQAAKYLKVSMSRIRQLIGDGRIKSHQPTDGRRDHLIKKSDLDEFNANERKENGRPPKDDE